MLSNLKQNLRFIRYRITGWLASQMTVSNAIFLFVIVAMCVLTLVVQKLEDPYPVRFLGSSYLPGPKNRRELGATTRATPRRKIVKKVVQRCTEEEDIEKALDKIIKNYHFLTDKNATTKKTTDMKTVNRYLPAIKLIYTPKIPFPLRLGVKKQTNAMSSPNESESIPDIYRKRLWRKMKKLDPPGTTAIKISGNAFPKRSLEVDRWRTISKSKNKVLAYSAYWDDRFDSPHVRVMVIMLTKFSPSIFCRMKMADGTFLDATASKKIMNEHWRLKYASYFVSCPLAKNHTPPLDVQLSIDANHSQSAILPIHHNKHDTESPRGEIAVCVKPLHYNYNRATWLLEFIEFHRMLGVDHFFFYNHTVGEHVEIVLRHYVANGLVTMLPWHTGIRSQKEIRTEGIFSSLNDCLFRTMYLFKYAIMLDFDEYIVPRDHDTYQDLIQQLEQDNKRIRGKPGSFVFRNTFFYLYWENDTTAFGHPPEASPSNLPYLITQYKTRRLSSSMKPGSRSKYIVVPQRAVEVGNHVVWRHTSGSRSINVPDAMALLHHYRICEFGGFSCLKKKSLVDRTATRFGPELLERVLNQCRTTFSDGKCPLSPPLGSPW